MTRDEVRALVRQLVADRLRERGVTSAGSGAPFAPVSTPPAHPSHAMFVSLVNIGDACVIEPDVACNHCGYCKSQGH